MQQSLVPAVLVIPLALSYLLVQNGRFQKISVPYHGRLPYFHPHIFIPHYLQNSQDVLNPLLFGFSIFLSNFQTYRQDLKIYIAQFGLFYVKIFEMTLFRTAMHKRYINSIIIITSVLQSRWPAQRKSYMYMNPEIREWKFKNNWSFLLTAVQQMQPTLILLCPRLLHTQPIRIPCDECVYPQKILLWSSVFSFNFVPSWFEPLGSAVTPNPMRFKK